MTRNGLNDKDPSRINFGDLPIGRNEDVEFSEALADEDDKEAEQRAAEADARAERE